MTVWFTLALFPTTQTSEHWLRVLMTWYDSWLSSQWVIQQRNIKKPQYLVCVSIGSHILSFPFSIPWVVQVILSTVGEDYIGSMRRENYLGSILLINKRLNPISPANYFLLPPMYETSLHLLKAPKCLLPLATASQSLESCMPSRSKCRWSFFSVA